MGGVVMVSVPTSAAGMDGGGDLRIDNVVWFVGAVVVGGVGRVRAATAERGRHAGVCLSRGGGGSKEERAAPSCDIAENAMPAL